VFTYSPEKGTASFLYPDTVKPEDKENRRREIMEIQAGLSLARNRGYVGRRIDVLVEGRAPGGLGLFVGRARFQAPEVDGTVRFSLPPGMDEPPSPLVRADIVSAGAYDLEGKLA
jgi:ribosomal protein S12 methylthiotransferase